MYGVIVAHSDATRVIEGNHYFPPDSGVQRVHLPGGLGERRHLPMLPVTVGDGITACSGDPPQPRGFVAGFGQTDERDRPEADVSPPALDDRPQDPATGAGFVDDEVQTVAVGVPTGLLPSHSHRREALLRVAATRFCHRSVPVRE